jgi:N-acetyl-gamma-glutamyl-phosphate reductase
MIAEYESDELPKLLGAPRQYGITQSHKHLPEMRAITGLSTFPIFCPIVSDFYSGMEVTVPLFASQLKNGKTVSDVKKLYADKYNTELVSYKESVDEAGFVAATAYAAKDTMTVSVAGNEERILLIALYDNLGKGASGAAVECMNIALGANKTQGLDI